MVAVTPVASSLPCPSSLPLRQLRIGIAALAWLAIFTGTARAQATWVGTVSNAWSAPGNWSPELVPFPGESIVVADITPGDRINLDVPATIGSFQLGSDGSRVAPLLNVYTGDRTFTIDGGLTAAGELDRVALRIRGNTTLGLDQVWDVGGEMGSVTIDRGVFVQNDGGNNLIQLTGSLTKTGSGQLSLGGVTVDGPGDIVVDAGALKLNAGFSRLLTVGGSGRIVVNDGAGLFISKNSGTMDVTRQIVMNGTAELIAGGGGFNLGTPNTIASPIEWNGTHRLGMINDNPTTFSGAWTGSGSISRSGGETITLSGDASGFTGTLSIADGTTNLDSSFSAGTVAVRGGSVTLGSATFGAALDVAGGTVTVGDLEVPLRSLSGSGGQVVGGSGSRLVVDQTADTSFAGSLGGSGSLALTKRGGGQRGLRLADAVDLHAARQRGRRHDRRPGRRRHRRPRLGGHRQRLGRRRGGLVHQPVDRQTPTSSTTSTASPSTIRQAVPIRASAASSRRGASPSPLPAATTCSAGAARSPGAAASQRAAAPA